MHAQYTFALHFYRHYSQLAFGLYSIMIIQIKPTPC